MRELEFQNQCMPNSALIVQFFSLTALRQAEFSTLGSLLRKETFYISPG